MTHTFGCYHDKPLTAWTWDGYGYVLTCFVYADNINQGSQGRPMLA